MPLTANRSYLGISLEIRGDSSSGGTNIEKKPTIDVRSRKDKR